jgi:hypothetical protein
VARNKALNFLYQMGSFARQNNIDTVNEGEWICERGRRGRGRGRFRYDVKDCTIDTPIKRIGQVHLVGTQTTFICTQFHCHGHIRQMTH